MRVPQTPSARYRDSLLSYCDTQALCGSLEFTLRIASQALSLAAHQSGAS